MALISVPGTKDVIVWSPIPVGAEFDKAVEEFSKGEKLNLYACIVPDREHTLNTEALKMQYPNLFVIGPSGISDKPNLKLDYTFEDSHANKVVSGSVINTNLSNFDFVFLNGHANGEVVMVDKSTKTLFEADLLFNIPHDGHNEEQYPGVNQNKGIWGYFTRTLNPGSRIGRFTHHKLLKKTPENVQGLKALLSTDFDSLVMSHGVVQETGGKAFFEKMFGSYL